MMNHKPVRNIKPESKKTLLERVQQLQDWHRALAMHQASTPPVLDGGKDHDEVKDNQLSHYDYDHIKNEGVEPFWSLEENKA